MVQRSIHWFYWRESHKILSEEDRQIAEHRKGYDQNLLQDNTAQRLGIIQGRSPTFEQIQCGLGHILSRLW